MLKKVISQNLKTFLPDRALLTFLSPFPLEALPSGVPHLMQTSLPARALSARS